MKTLKTVAAVVLMLLLSQIALGAGVWMDPVAIAGITVQPNGAVQRFTDAAPFPLAVDSISKRQPPSGSVGDSRKR